MHASIRSKTMRLLSKYMGFASAAMLGIITTTIPAAAATCNVKDVITNYTARKTALRDIRLALKKLTAALAGDTPGNVVDYGPPQFDGFESKQWFANAIAARQAEFSIVILQFAGNCGPPQSGSSNPTCTTSPAAPPTTCYVCAI